MSQNNQEIKQEVKEEVMAWEINYLDDNITVDPLHVEVITTEEFKNMLPKKTVTKKYTPQCRTCDEKFIRDEELNIHYKNNESHKPKRYMCSMCHRSFDFLNELRCHKMSIHGEAPTKIRMLKPKTYECDICEKAYIYPHSLQQHISILHSGKTTQVHRGYLCEHCGTLFPTNKTLLTHTHKVHNDKICNDKLKECIPYEFECVFCYERFPFKFSLERHLKIHRSLKKYDCPMCGKSFGGIRSMKIHKCLSSADRLVSEPKVEEQEPEEVNFSDEEFTRNFRMSRETFSRVLLLIKDEITKDGCRPPISVPGEVQLQLALWYFGTTDVFRIIYSHFNIAQQTARRCLLRVTQALVDLAPSIITWPCGDVLEEVKNGFGQTGLSNTIGTIGTTHIHTHCAPKVNRAKDLCKHDYPSITLQAVCDHTLKFTNCYVKVAGATPNAQMLMQSDVWTFIKEQKNLMFPDDTHLVGNATYPCLPELMTPFEGALTDKQTEFNRLLDSTESTVEKAFDLLENRFRCLNRLLHKRSKSPEWVPKYVLACCVLHNICVMRNDLIEVAKVRGADDGNVEADFKDVDRARLDLGIQKRNGICEKLIV